MPFLRLSCVAGVTWSLVVGRVSCFSSGTAHLASAALWFCDLWPLITGFYTLLGGGLFLFLFFLVQHTGIL